MNFDFRLWDIHTGAHHPFNDRAPRIDNGTGRPDPTRYHGADYKDAEWNRMWTQTWLLAGPTSDLRDDGDFVREPHSYET